MSLYATEPLMSPPAIHMRSSCTVPAWYPRSTHGGGVAVWVQDEPVNMGAWPALRGRWGDAAPGGRPLTAVARAESASPATGSASSHRLEQQQIFAQAFAPATAVPARRRRGVQRKES